MTLTPVVADGEEELAPLVKKLERREAREEIAASRIAARRKPVARTETAGLQILAERSEILLEGGLVGELVLESPPALW